MTSLPAYAHGQAAIAVVRVEAFIVQGELHQGDVLPDHALQGHTARAGISVSLRDEVPEKLQNLLQDGALDQHSSDMVAESRGGGVKRKVTGVRPGHLGLLGCDVMAGLRPHAGLRTLAGLRTQADCNELVVTIKHGRALGLCSSLNGELAGL